MDILNNIWNSISTPNEGLINICFIFLIPLIDTPLILMVLINVFNLTLNSFQKKIYLITISISALVSMFFIPQPFNVFFNYIIIFLIIFFSFKVGFFKAIVMTIFPSFLFSIMENLLLHPYLSLLGITYEQASTIFIYRIPFAFLIYGMVFLITCLFKYKNLTIKFFDNLDIKSKSLIIFNFIFGIVIIAVQFIITIKFIDVLPIYFTFFNCICLLIYFSLSIYSLTRVMKLLSTTQKLESAEEYNKTLHILHDSVRGFKHDFDNIVTTIGGYIKTNDIEGLEKYYSQLQEDCSKVNNLYILNPDIINNPGIYNLLTTKYNESEEKGIKVTLTFLLDLNNINMKIYEFARILGILLDNAIEAASECDDKILNITFRNDSKNSRNLVIIENTYKDKNVNIENIFNKGISGKENHTGLGLWEVRQILNKNNNVNLHTDKNEEYFIQQLEIYY